MFLLAQQIFGWPLYLFFNATGRPYDRWANHFDPYSPIFSKRERIEVSDAARTDHRYQFKHSRAL